MFFDLRIYSYFKGVDISNQQQTNLFVWGNFSVCPSVCRSLHQTFFMFDSVSRGLVFLGALLYYTASHETFTEIKIVLKLTFGRSRRKKTIVGLF